MSNTQTVVIEYDCGECGDSGETEVEINREATDMKGDNCESCGSDLEASHWVMEDVDIELEF